MTLEQLLDQVVKDNKMVAFVKGTRTQPACGFSFKMMTMLNELKLDYEVGGGAGGLLVCCTYRWGWGWGCCWWLGCEWCLGVVLAQLGQWSCWSCWCCWCWPTPFALLCPACPACPAPPPHTHTHTPVGLRAAGGPAAGAAC